MLFADAFNNILALINGITGIPLAVHQSILIVSAVHKQRQQLHLFVVLVFFVGFKDRLKDLIKTFPLFLAVQSALSLAVDHFVGHGGIFLRAVIIGGVKGILQLAAHPLKGFPFGNKLPLRLTIRTNNIHPQRILFLRFVNQQIRHGDHPRRFDLRREVLNDAHKICGKLIFLFGSLFAEYGVKKIGNILLPDLPRFLTLQKRRRHVGVAVHIKSNIVQQTDHNPADIPLRFRHGPAVGKGFRVSRSGSIDRSVLRHIKIEEFLLLRRDIKGFNIIYDNLFRLLAVLFPAPFQTNDIRIDRMKNINIQAFLFGQRGQSPIRCIFR